MNEATEATVDIREALDEYGSDVILKPNIKGDFDPLTGDYATSGTPENLKAIIRQYTPRELENSEIHVRDLRFMLYTETVIDENFLLAFQGRNYKIMHIEKKILQDTNLYYIIQGRA